MEVHGRLDEDLEEDYAELEAVGAEQRFTPEDDVKDVPEGDAEALPHFVLRGRHVGDGVDDERRDEER